ncbi:dihydroorotate dehydrogenase electron transfer subunit [Aquibacillus rhizosphaerae]|uniref:Dihydroorotate dehydrogenase B (NAD(+)), electron transfer subunit n=1 Tax=Aquibacillus rhizosphaerae TaxID=3051431 RepID=A0ABT7L2B8_9BACI|nr:dihydroorotate dehydrogenase electron transfer subunit [Aquibacillus sp. LR5S19]MDL4839999.1 dihydroorotate dehydrogenase electron transfer subunit [Aquibacillus sp. LR5S19]
MINKELLTIVETIQIAKETIKMRLQGSEKIKHAKPGQFVHIKVGNEGSHMLRRPISIADVNQDQQIVTIIFKVIGSGTDHLSKCHVGDVIDGLIPCGTSYPIEQITMDKALLIGGGIGVPPLYYLAKQIKEQGVEVTSILGFQSSEHVFYQSEFAELGKCHIVTNDGTHGFQGFVTDVIDQLDPTFDYYFSCGPTPMLKAVSSKLQDRNGYISIEQRMGCGIGACYACVVPTNDGSNGFKKICKDGPVFEANEVVL